MISTALMMENPVNNPIVPPIADKTCTGFTAASLVILSNVGVSKEISTTWRLGLSPYSAQNSLTFQYLSCILTFEFIRKLVPAFVIIISLRQLENLRSC